METNWSLEFGDVVEKMNVAFIRKNIKKYETFWAKYIGCKNGSAVAIKNIKNADNETRLLVGQWNYSIMKDIVGLNLLNEKYAVEDFTPTKMLQFESDYTISITQFYHILDSIEHIQKQIKIAPMSYDRDNFNKLRETIIHDVRVKLQIEDNQFMVPENFDWFTNRKDGWTWDNYDFTGLKYIPFSSFLNALFQRSISLFTETLQRTLIHFEENFEKRGLVIENHDYDNKLEDLSCICPSGYTFISGSGSGYNYQ